MKTYSFTEPHVTAHDVCESLGIGKQTLMYWLTQHELDHTKVQCGEKIGVTLIPQRELVHLRKLNKKRLANRDG